MKKELLILGPSPFNKDINHAGGQLTAITNLVKYIENNRISYDIVDTFRSTFPAPSIKNKLISSFRMYRELQTKLKKSSYKGAVVFSSYGFGFWEKLFFSLLIERHTTKTLFFIRSGHFMQHIIDKKYNVPIKKFLMNRLSYIGHQGGNWESLYANLGIKKDKLIKILNWIEIDKYSKQFDNSVVTFLYVGWMVKEKGVKELIDTVLENRTLDRFNFIFIGGGTLLEELKSKVEKSDSTNIHFTGWLEKSEIIPYYKKADGLILPSHAEGFPNVILEALNYRLPVIATDVGAVSESIIDGKNGFLIEAKNKEELLSSILKLGASKKLREEFSLNSEKILIDNHSIDNNCKKIFNLFKE